MFLFDLLQSLPKIGNWERDGTKHPWSAGGSFCFASGMQRISASIFLSAFSPFLYKGDHENTN